VIAAVVVCVWFSQA